jgi:hypothetical protein
VNVRIMGLVIGGIESIDYDASEGEAQAVYNQGSREVAGFALGAKQLVNVTVTMREDAFQKFATPAKAAGKTVLDYWPFPITVTYADYVKDGDYIDLQKSAINTDTLDQCKVTKVSKPNKKSDRQLVRTLNIKARAVV